MPGSRKGIPNAPRRTLERLLDEKWPGYKPAVRMAEHAHRLDQIAQESGDREDYVAAVAAHDKVAAYVMPKLKAVEVSGANGGPFLIQQAPGDAEL